MIIKKFVAPTMPEALSRVKKELGDQAVILKTRINKKTGGQNSQKGVEITAAIESDLKSRFEMTPEKSTEENTGAKKTSVKKIETETPVDFSSEKFDDLVNQIANLKKSIEKKSHSNYRPSFFGSLPSELIDAGRELIDRNISEELAVTIISRLAQTENPFNLKKEEINTQIMQTLSSMIPAGEPIEIKETGPTVVMFVGPTGSGKTTAIARVAMHHKIENNSKVAMITTDNFRADSTEQIKSFCRIIGCPCGITYTPEELSMAVKSQEQGLILIDTPGICPDNTRELGELQSLIKAAKPHEIHLVIPASIPARDVEKMIKAFGEFGIDKILITKLDETEAPGGVITAVIKSGKKLSYISNSREIPGRFAPAVSESLASALTISKPAESEKQKWEMEAVGIWQ